MTVVNPKSISGINSITMASGSDNLLTIHANDTSEKVRVNSSGDVIVGSGVTLSPDGDVFATGVCTATSFSGDGSNLTGLSGVSVANQADNRLITATGTTDALNGESSLTYSSTGDLTQTVTVDGKGIVLSAGNLKPMITGDANRAAEGNTILGISGKWNGTEVARIAVEAGADTTNKDDATLNFSTTTSGGSLTKRMVIDSSGHALPGADNSYDLGSSSKRWRNVYTTDLKLSNEGKTNDVDGTWGDWTLQEGENDIFMINNRSGKKFKIKMEEVS
jgi:hypothetical protein